MKDTIIKGTGNSRYMKSVANVKSLYPTYDDFLSALIDGNFPIDLNGINPDGLTQAGTDLTKANLLSDTTKSAIGLTQADPTIDNALAAMVLPLTMHKGISNATALSASGLATGDYIGLSDTSAGTGKKVTLTNLATYLSTLSSFSSTYAKIQVGSYTGTGTYGSANPNSITCSFAPKLVIIVEQTIGSYPTSSLGGVVSSSLFWINGLTYANGYNGGTSSGSAKYRNTFTATGNKISWYATQNDGDVIGQCNKSNVTYYWVAFG